MRHYCTYFDSNYLSRALALYQSLKRNSGEFVLYVLCLDDDVYRELMSRRLPELVLLPLVELEIADSELKGVKQERTLVEYYFTCTSALCAHLLHSHSEMELLTYLDADLFFYSDPDPILDEMGGSSVGIIEHRFSRSEDRRLRYGRYNVGLISFRNNADGRACANWWRERCLDWCHDRIEEGKFADQKYLDEWPSRFKGVKVISHPGGNVAVWNADRYRFSWKDGAVYVDDKKLIFFHFASFRRVSKNMYRTFSGAYHYSPGKTLRHHVYAPYIEAIQSLEWTPPSDRGGILQRKAGRSVSIAEKVGRLSRFLCGIIFWEYIILWKGRVL